MTNFFTELDLFIKNCECINTDGIFFEYEGTKIPYDIAQQIHGRLIGDAELIDECEKTIAEQSDFIRLLREENARLRGVNR